MKLQILIFLARLRKAITQMRTRSKSKAEKHDAKKPRLANQPEFLSVICGAVSLTDKRKKSKVRTMDIPCRATFAEVLALLSTEFGVSDGEMLRIGKLK